MSRHHFPFRRNDKNSLPFSKFIVHRHNYKFPPRCTTIRTYQNPHKNPLNQGRKSGRLTPDLPMLRRTKIQQPTTILITGRLFAYQRVDTEVPLLVNRWMATRQRSGPRWRRIDLSDRRSGDWYRFVQWRRWFQEASKLQSFQRRRRKVQQWQTGWRR